MKKRWQRSRMESLEPRQVLSVTPLVEPVLVSHFSDAGEVAYTSVVDGVAEQSEPTLHNRGNDVDFEKAFTADFTGDGVTDFLGHDANNWWLQVNDGTQLFNVELGEKQSNGEVVGAADITNDGKLDAVIVDRTSGEIFVLINEGNTANEVLWGQMSGITEDSYIFVDDYSGDGLVDVIVGNLGDAWTLAENTGSDFANVRYSDFPEFAWESVLTGDFSGDDVGDIAVRGPDQTWWVWFGKEGGFDPAKFWGHWKNRDTWHDVHVGDFTNDGRDDLIGRTEDGRLWVGSATDTRFHTWTWSKGWVDEGQWSNITLVDMDGDGLLDQVGKSRKDYWWFAHNVGDRFENHFWMQSPVSDDVEVVERVLLSEAVNVAAALPDGGYDVTQTSLQISLDDSNKLVLTGNVRLTGLSLTSASSGLITSSNVDPFIGTLVNVPTNVTLIAALGGFYELNGSVTLDTGWDPDADSDLVAEYGASGLTGSLLAEVSAELGPEVDPLEFDFAETNVDYYFSDES